MFKRTSGGLAAESRFYGSDFVLYCEGEPENDVLSLDELYWQQTFEKFGIKIKCKSTGSKSALASFADEVKKGTKNIIVAMDRDYDEFYASMESNNRIIYTLGYSFESDVIEALNPIKAGSLFVNIRNEETFETKFNEYINNNNESYVRASIIDIRYIKSPVSLFNRKKPLSIIKYSKTLYPKIDLSQFMKNVVEARKSLSTSNTSPTIPSNFIGTRVFFGKAVSHMAWQFFQIFSKRYARCRNVNYDLFISSMIREMNYASGSNEISVYYQNMIKKIKEEQKVAT